ncbi:oligopeptide transport system permease protein [Ureaplasma urealyticum serovar 10 str. ATCC 33699]|uniref:ABC transporter ATP-binding protein n=2 Tax=Ureaplasma urealyticum TaxID=2130 RepID=A0AAX1QXT6_UREUR|nr:ABC transporter ATP-binding protein [Ureaplasma urealyticum]ACI60291.1 oligopeptide transport system permease protein [Ureaplasma urealyticum serovar 10 str. ATCC 33699]EDT49626.1 oligopeptide transport system permease protein [Ureaplasma urealyticum serovar 13 str. ATCC 33698]QDI63948.1 ABC transporter ATP-binding protein [Ureaplasma urealyticum]RCJ00605.1 ABC transporter ATP-binding protein [Ureaplasma urealyticum]UNT66176.1 ABC transporter ATP-binding protein [Ureaplasma urealyticum]
MSDTNQKKAFFNHKKRFCLPDKITIRPVTEGLLERLNANPEKKRLVEVRHLDVTYGHGFKKFRAVKDISFNIYQGEVLGLVGESGSGKSTTGSALIGLARHSFGDIIIDGVKLPKQGEKVTKELTDFMVNNVQMIFQDPSNSLNPYVNIETVVSEGLNNIKDLKKSFLRLIYKDYLRGLKKELKAKNLANNEQVQTFLEKAQDLKFDYLNETNQQELIQLFNELELANLSLDNNNKKLEKAFNDINTWKSKTRTDITRHLILDVLKSVGLDETVLRRYPLEFSGGQQQRIGISRAVALRPKLLIADEPISALDVSIQAQVVNIFKELKAKYDLTILFIAHDLRMVEYISDRIAVMNKGVLLEIGPTKEIVKNFLHPYTRSLMEAVPSIDSDKKSLLGYVYDANMHGYTHEKQPKWIHLGNDHYILGTEEEVADWKAGKY